MPAQPAAPAPSAFLRPFRPPLGFLCALAGAAAGAAAAYAKSTVSPSGSRAPAPVMEAQLRAADQFEPKEGSNSELHRIFS